jgi:hypothetical protein
LIFPKNLDGGKALLSSQTTFVLHVTARGTMPKLTQRFELGSNWTALKLPVVGTRLRGTAAIQNSGKYTQSVFLNYRQ